MRTRILAALTSAVLIVPTAGVAVAADAPPPPPTIAPLCVTDKEYLWKVSSDATGLRNYHVDYTTQQTDAWTWPHAITETPLVSAPSGGHAATIDTSRSDGTSLFVRWSDFPAQLASTSTAPTTACATASLTVKRIVQGGAASADAFPVTVARSVISLKDPALSETIATPMTSDTPQAVQPGMYFVGPTKDGDAYAALPAGHVFRSNSCVAKAGGAQGAVPETTTDPQYQRLLIWLDPGSTAACAITYHYGPVLEDSIAAGKKTSGTTGFKTSTITVKKGTWVTYLVSTSPSLAGKKVQIWTKVGSATKPWNLTKTVTVTSDGSIRYYAKVTTFTGFLAKWAGDGTYVASAADGRYVKVN